MTVTADVLLDVLSSMGAPSASECVATVTLTGSGSGSIPPGVATCVTTNTSSSFSGTQISTGAVVIGMGAGSFALAALADDLPAAAKAVDGLDFEVLLVELDPDEVEF